MTKVVQLQEAPLKPEAEEIATAGRDITRGFVGKIMPNPDEVLSKEAISKGYDLYDEMEDKDPQIASLLQTRRLGVLSKEREIVPASEAPKDIEIADFVRLALDHTPRFDEDLYGLLDAVPKGFAVAEILWELEGKSVTIADIRSRKQDRFAFGSDGLLRLLTTDNPFEGIGLPDCKFIIHRHGGRYENPYGEAALKSVYWYWWFKKNTIKFWVIFAEKFGMPTAVGKYPEGTKSDKQDDLLAACEAIQTDNAVVIPEGMVIEFLEAQRRGSIDTYQGFLDYLDSQIAKAILGQTLTSGEGQHGTQALGTVHEGVRQDILEADAASLETTVNNQLIPWLVDFNFSGVADYPYLKIHAEQIEDLQALSERDERLIKIGLPISVAYFYNRYRVPPPAEDDELVAPPTRPTGPAAEFQERGQPEIARDTDKLIASAVKRAAQEYGTLIKAVTFRVAEASSFDEASAALKAEGLIETGAKILSPLLADTLLTSHLTGRAAIMKKAEAAGRREAARLSEAISFQEAFAPGHPLPPEEAIKFFKGLTPLTPDEVLALADEARAKAFTVSRVESQRLIDAVHAEITKSLEQGTTFTEFKKTVNAIFERRGVTPLNPYHLETVFTNNVSSAYSAGRYMQKTDPAIQGFFPLWVYQTMDDGDVRPSHETMHGHTAPPDDPVWQTWYAPNGHRCRCWVDAINKFEVEERRLQASKAAPAVQPDKGFAGNPAARGAFG